MYVHIYCTCVYITAQFNPIFIAIVYLSSQTHRPIGRLKLPVKNTYGLVGSILVFIKSQNEVLCIRSKIMKRIFIDLSRRLEHVLNENCKQK